MTSCKDLLITKKIEMTFYSIMESISHLGKMARISAISENPRPIASILFAKVVLRTYALKRYARQWSPPLV